MLDFEFKHAYKHPVKQVKFSSYSDPAAPKSYFNDVQNIAEFIGDSLSFRDYRGYNVSTIRVSQAKEKFGRVRVYCSFADPMLVARKWEAYNYSKMLSDVTSEFMESCLFHDADRYRRVHKRIANLLPHYYDVIHACADFPGLLCESKEELDELISSPFHSSSGFNVEIPEQLDKLYNLCGFVR